MRARLVLEEKPEQIRRGLGRETVDSLKGIRPAYLTVDEELDGAATRKTPPIEHFRRHAQIALQPRAQTSPDDFRDTVVVYVADRHASQQIKPFVLQAHGKQRVAGPHAGAPKPALLVPAAQENFQLRR